MNIFLFTTITDVLSSLGLVFVFLFNQLGAVANFFISNELGMIILALVIFGLLIDYIVKLINR